MKHIKLSATKRKKANTMHIENEDIRDLMVSDDFEVLVEVNEESTSEILISVILWVGFLVVDLADDEEKKLVKVEKISK
ncbi:MAG: hypothetical protein WCL02_07195 [bacterium]